MQVFALVLGGNQDTLRFKSRGFSSCVCVFGFFFTAATFSHYFLMSKLNLDYHVLVYVLEVMMPPSIFILKSFLWKLFWTLQKKKVQCETVNDAGLC